VIIKKINLSKIRFKRQDPRYKEYRGHGTVLIMTNERNSYVKSGVASKIWRKIIP
jgi:hypothetical protein